MSELPPCEVCGCLSYNKVSGFYVCANCDTQSQGIQVQLFDYSTNLRGEDEEEREEFVTQRIEKERALTSWEIYNLTLKQIIEELINLGASPELKIVAFQIWATYLQKANLAFFSKQNDKLPPLPIGFKSSDAKVLYGISNLRKIVFKDVLYKKRKKEEDLQLDLEVGSSSSSASNAETISIRSLRHKQRKLALSELSDSSIMEDSMFSHNESLQTLGSENSKKKKKEKTISFKSSMKNILKDMITASKRTKNLNQNDKLLQKVKTAITKRITDSKRKPGATNDMVVTFTTVISVIRIALLLTGDDIQLGDIMRWIGEGHISHYLKSTSTFDSRNLDSDKVDFRICNRNGFQTDIENFTKSIRLDRIPTPNLYKLTERYCKELCLPDEFVHYVHKIMDIFQPEMDYSKYNFRKFPDYECRVLAYILFAFKLLFSMDGITEKRQSEFADYVNELHSTKSDIPLLFSWNAWVQYIECRKSTLAKYNPAINTNAYQRRVDHKDVFLKNWEKLKPSSVVHCYPINDVFISTATQTLRKVIPREESEPHIEFPGSLTPHSTCIAHLQQNHPQQIKQNAFSILEKKFANYSIRHLLDRQWCQDIATISDATIEFVEGSAEVDVKFYKEDESVFPTLSKTTTVPAYAPTSVVVVNDESVENHSRVPNPSNHKCKNFRFNFELFEDVVPDCSSTNQFKIYNPAKRNWFFHEFNRNMSNDKFHELVETHLSESFVWLLKELASVVTGEIRELYLELITIEAVMYSLLMEENYDKKCPFSVYPSEW